MPKILQSLCLAILCFAGTTFASTQVSVPKNDGWVTDLAGLISPATERSLETLMESYRQGSGHEIALLTIPELKGESIERLGLEVGRAWGLGEKGKNNGALLLVAVKDRKLRIEVGRGLEGELTDSRCGRIIRDVIAPYFRKGNPEQGIEQGILAIHQVIGGDYASIGGRGKGGVSAAGIIFLLLLLMMLRGGRMGALPWILLSGGGRGGGFGGGGGGFGGFGGGGGFSGGGASGGW